MDINIKFFQNFDDFISSNISNIDGAIISTPSSMHLEHAEPFIQKGIPLLIEKPLTSDNLTDQTLFALAKENNTLMKPIGENQLPAMGTLTHSCL